MTRALPRQAPVSLPLVRPGEAIAPGRAALPPRGLVVANDHTSNVCIDPGVAHVQKSFG